MAKLYDRLSALDRSFLDLEDPNAHMHVAGAFLFDAKPLRRADGGIDIERIEAYIESRLHLIPRYRQRIAWTPVEGHPVWVDDDRFQIHYHVRHTSLPAPGDIRQLKRLCGRVISQQLDRGKPLWEVWVVEGIEGDRMALVSKVHHCMVDGVSGVDLLQVLLSPFPQEDFEPAPQWSPRREPRPVELARDAALRRLRAPRLMRLRVQRALRDPQSLSQEARDTLEGIREVVLQGFRPSLDTPLNRKIGPHRRFDWIAMDIDEVKRVKKTLGGTVNDVVLAATAGAVGRFLERHGISEHDQRNSEFRVFCPVSVRRSSERGALGNRVSSMIARLPIAERHPRRRLEAVSKTMGDLKKSKQALGAEVLTSVSEWTSPTLISAAARLSFRNRASNMVVTNVPGPQIPLYLLGARMLETYPMVPLFLNQCLGIALFSYCGGLYWGLNADWDQLPDLHDFVEDLEASFKELRDTATSA